VRLLKPEQYQVTIAMYGVITGRKGLLPLFILLLSVFWLPSCNETPRQVNSTDHMQMTDDTVLKYNHQVVVAESQEIEDFISRYHWEMQKSQTGLRWMVYKKGKGTAARKGDIACIKYSLRLLNGDLVYRSDSLKPFEFETGKAEVPNGLEEGVLLLRPGDRARLIVPSHLAFGLLGDFDKIRNRASLVYDIELCGLKKGKNN
jgi:FKBP-type peptidyl-prolyl cis-trans isomerase FkpA